MFKKNQLFYEYYADWLKMYKEGSVREVTMKKYRMTLHWLEELAPKLRVKNLDRTEYQTIINKYAETHEKQTVMDFHRQVKSAIVDALDEGLLKKDPTRRVILKGKLPSDKKEKYLSLEELKKLVSCLNLGKQLNYDWLIYLISKTGFRFSEAVGLTPKDFDFDKSTISINKTWDYKNGGGFAPTKNDASVRVIPVDKKLCSDFKGLIKNMPMEKPIFINISRTDNIFNATINDILDRYCKKSSITNITLHGLRHTHGSILLYKGVSVSSISKRLGHADIATTQRVYLHIIQELENRDKELLISSLAEI